MVEVLLATVRRYELLVGKVSRIVLLALGQLVITALAAAGALMLSDLDPDLSGIGVWEVAHVALGFFLGLVLYSMLYGALAPLASRQADAQSLALPAVIVLMVGYFIVVFALIGGDPDGPLARGVSLFPFTAPIAMPPRVALGDVPAWEFALSVLLTLGATAAVSFIGGRIYEAAILQTGPRIGFRQALRYIRR